MATAKKKAAGGTIKVRRTGSPIRREYDQRTTLLGLGLKRANQVVELEDTPSIQGMIRKVAHLVEVVK
ncbi:50S ribosomal protein L30 [Candidatus Viadribacter manganicus]|uniref:Large ribosomal subunit protein uL30 n=1 Tax=Candidatus Viadribacter manganicus TaxID=1759059 RepID=A0A1B1AMN8_9PROT|nr:50S ribosomal protein L30 [Candidatus Viadribacter manganicus]ANP47824.1 50S ribosomal protein L30 [Candidatus Viadribacter manganicus]